MLNGAEAYLEMWERAEGIPSRGCTRTHALRLGASWIATLRSAGQPHQRGQAMAWCVKGGGADVAVLGADGKVTLVGSTARGHSLGGAKVGARMPGSGAEGPRAQRLRAQRRARARGRDHAAAREGPARRGHPRARREGRAGASPRSSANARASAALTGKPLAATGNPATDAQLALLCSLLSSSSSH